MLIATDFDGTISKQDGLKMILDHFVGAPWKPIETAMKTGLLAERVGLRRCMEMLQATEDEVLDFILKNVQLDESFKVFARWARSEGHSLVILSSGIQAFIEALLKRDGLEEVMLWANQADWDGRRWHLTERSGPRICKSQSHCKCASILRLNKKSEAVVFIGDGHSDRCAVRKADQVFAKSWLADYCESEKISYHSFSRFSDVLAALRETEVDSEVRLSI